MSTYDTQVLSTYLAVQWFQCWSQPTARGFTLHHGFHMVSLAQETFTDFFQGNINTIFTEYCIKSFIIQTMGKTVDVYSKGEVGARLQWASSYCSHTALVSYKVGTLDSANCALHSAQCTLYSTPCTLKSEHCKLEITHCPLQNAHYKLHFTLPWAKCSFHKPYFTLHSVHCILHKAHCTLNSTHWSLHGALFKLADDTLHFTLPNAHCAHTSQCILHTTLWPVYPTPCTLHISH